MFTKNIYYTNPYLTKLQTEVISHQHDEEGWWYTFRETIFYPEGGGQDADKGWINNISVQDVQTKNDDIWHLLESSIVNPITMRLDWKDRYGNMQQHTGQHILSACFKDRHDLDTVSVHLGRDITMIELETKKINDEILQDTENAANEIIRQNLTVEPVWVKKEELGAYSLRRSIKTVDQNIRLIKIGDIDCVGCGGTHVQSTSEVGLIKIIGTEKIRNRARVKIKIGNAAYQYFMDLHNTLQKLSIRMTTSLEDMPERIDQLLSENRNLGRKINKINDLWLSEYARNLPESVYPGCYFLPDLSKDQLKSLTESWLNINQNPCLFISKDQGRMIFFTRLPENSTQDIQLFMKENRVRFSIKGGGGKDFAIGEINHADADALLVEQIFKSFVNFLI
jgi:alanyl-tRNA synthetase